MEAVHDYIIPESNGVPLGAVYHSATPAWGVLDNTLYGAVLRNSPSGCGSKGASGSDGNVYNIHYAFRVTSGLFPPQTGQPLQEARLYQTPLRAVYIDQLINPTAQLSLLAITNPSSALITTVKQGSKDNSKLYLRIYNPTNIPTLIQLQVNFPATDVNLVTALEKEDINLKRDAKFYFSTKQSFGFMATNALSTISLNSNIGGETF